MDIKDRIRLVMEKEHIASGAFAESIGIQQSTLSHILNGRNNPSLDVVMKVHQRYTYLNLEWLLYGTGSMTEKDRTTTSTPDYHPSLFDQNPVNPVDRAETFKKRQEIALEAPKKETKEPVIQEIKYIEKPPRKITEIRIFFDDNTYETFRGEK